LDILTFGAAFLAGLLTFLNPCVLPVLPIVFGAAAHEHRLGPVAIASGLALSFTAIGLFIATAGVSLGLDTQVFRFASAIMLILFGGLLLLPQVQYRVQAAMGPVSNWAARRWSQRDNAGLSGQFGLGVLLGAMWSPCVGPTLGAATLLAAQGEQLGAVALAMLLFGLGASIPLLLLGTLLRSKLRSWSVRMNQTGQAGRRFLGAAMAVAGALVLTGLDKSLEILFLDYAPTWLSTFGTQI
jgi:cytochrome c-type biogenesis protein